MTVDKNSPLPRHFLLREAIKRDSFKNGLRNGDLIPSERDLAEKYDVSRVTVRRTIADLVEEGFLRREGRKGTYINDVSSCMPFQSASRKHLIGLQPAYIRNWFAMRLMSTLEDELSQMGYHLALGNSKSDPASAKIQVERLASEGVAGFVLLPVPSQRYREDNEELANFVTSMGLPFVYLDCYVDGISADTVVSDNFDGAYDITKHLIDVGHRRIAYLAGTFCSTVRDRELGFRKCLMDNGISPDERIIHTIENEPMEEALDYLLGIEPKVTAIFAFTDGIVPSMLKVFADRKISVPDDIAIVGYDHSFKGYGGLMSVTSVDQPLEDEARLASRLIVERVNGYSGEARFHTLKSRLFLGDSTKCSQSYVER